MPDNLALESIYAPSKDIVAREIQGEFIIVPVIAGVGNFEDEIFALNKSGQAIWRLLDGKRTLNDVVGKLALRYRSSQKTIKKDVAGFTRELLKRKILTRIED